MLTQAENDTLTRVGRVTPAGELLRRYWHVAGAACELTAEAPVKAIRLLGEGLVLFRMPPAPGASEPGYGLVEEHCPHRLASFRHGIVDCEGIRCIYHGWKFSADGRTCLEQPPFEVSPFKDGEGNFRLDFIPAQDALAWESQGALTDRTREHIGLSDRGVVMLRKLIREQIDAVKRGEDPIGVIRNPADNAAYGMPKYLGISRAHPGETTC